MFTGIVEEKGTVLRAEKTGDGFVLRVGALLTLQESKPGDSISVNGTCLTIVEMDDSSFQFRCRARVPVRAPTSVDSPPGANVNLERSVDAVPRGWADTSFRAT